ncbi:hypothetical protein BDW75DRAFT_243104 [Aspergillus navahoensis]
MKHSTIPTVLSLGLGLLASIAGAVEMAVVSSSISLRRDDCYNFQVPIAIAEVDPDSENDRDFECYFYAHRVHAGWWIPAIRTPGIALCAWHEDGTTLNTCPVGPGDKPSLNRYPWCPRSRWLTQMRSLGQFTTGLPESGYGAGVPSTTACVTGPPRNHCISHTRAEGSRNTNSGTLRAVSGSPSSLRESRFDTLSDEVDSALSVVYRELEEVPLLRKPVADLEHKMASLRQDLSVYKNEIALSKRTGSANDVKGSTARNNDLERENTDLRAQLEKPDQTLKEWKEKLVGKPGNELISRNTALQSSPMCYSLEPYLS